MTLSTSSVSPSFLGIPVTYASPLVTGAVAGAVDRFYFKQPNTQRNLMFGTAVAVGFLAGNMLIQYVPTLNHVSINSPLEATAIKTGLGTGAGLMADRFVFNSNLNRIDMGQRALAIVGSSIVADYVVNNLNPNTGL